MCTNDEYIGTSNPLPFWGKGGYFERKCALNAKFIMIDSDFIDVAFDVPRVHVSDPL